MSEHDIPKGKRWLSHMNDQLAEVGTGIICLTPDSLNAPWVLFEAGALAKSLTESFVCPYLFKLTPTTVEWPLAQFQLTEANKDDTRKLLSTINDALEDNKLTAGDLDESFEKWWPDLEHDLKGIKPKVSESPKRTDRELLEETLGVVRQLARAIPTPGRTEIRGRPLPGHRPCISFCSSKRPERETPTYRAGKCRTNRADREG